MTSRSSISFKKRHEIDEMYRFPLYYKKSTQATENSTVMIEELDNGEVRIIAGDIPGMTGYYKNYDIEGDEEAERRHELARERLDKAMAKLEEYDPKTSSSKANSGNMRMCDIYVEVPGDQRDEVVFRMWQVLNQLRNEYLAYLEKHEPDKLEEYDTSVPMLSDEVLEISKFIQIKSKALI